MATARKLKGTWTPGRIQVYGTRHVVRLPLVGGGEGGFVFELLPQRRYRFCGVERAVVAPRGDFAGDLPPAIEHIGAGCVSRAVWLRIYEDDRARRSYFE